MKPAHHLTLFLVLTALLFSTGLQAQYVWHYTDSCNNFMDCEWVQVVDTPAALWQTGAPDKPWFDQALVGSRAVVTDTALAYPAGTDAYFLVKIVDAYSTVITFDHKLDTDSLHDGGFVEASYDKGMTWSNVAEWFSNYPGEQVDLYGMYALEDTLVDGTPAFSGRSEWQQSSVHWIYHFPVGPHGREIDTIYARFHFQSDDVWDGRDGWMIDRIRIGWIDIGSGIDDPNTPGLSVFPNPASERVMLTLDGVVPSDAQILVYDRMGRIRHQTQMGKDRQLALDVSAWESGLYIMRYADRNGQTQRSFVVE